MENIHPQIKELEYNYIADGIYIGTNQCCQTHFDERLKKEDVTADISLEKERIDALFGVDFYLWLPVEDHAPPVFVLGDMASFSTGGGKELPMLAQVASKEADAAADNIKHMILRKPLMPFRYRHTGDLISLGQWMAVADIKNGFFWGRASWWLWKTVYFFKLISLPKKVEVAVDWTINLFMPRDISEL